MNQNNSKENSSLCRCTTTSNEEPRQTNAYVWQTHQLWVVMQKESLWVMFFFSEPVQKRKWIATDTVKLVDRVAELMMERLSGSGRPKFRATSALDRGQLRSKGGGRSSIHFCADEAIVGAIFRTVVCVNQLSVRGAVEALCQEFGHPSIDSEKIYAVMEQSESVVASGDLFKKYSKTASDQ